MKNLIVFIALLASPLLAQPELDLKPNKIEFRDIFDRLENVLFINKGDENLIIDTMEYNKDFYYVRFDKQWEYPVVIPPGDTLKMDCLLANYFLVTSLDTLDTMKIFYSGYSRQENLKIRIRFFDDEDKYGTVTGSVADSVNPVAGAKVYFYYEGSYLFDSVITDNQGKYSKNLPEGEYVIAAEKEGYYYNFFQNKFDKYTADMVKIKKDSVLEVNFNMQPKMLTPNRISGKVIDFVSRAPVKKGIIVVRKGKHTPTKLSPEMVQLSDSVKSYTGNIGEDGSFYVDNIIEPGYYYVQAFSDFYLPAYTSNDSLPAILWQQTDSVFIQNSVGNQTIILKRDSSYGGGEISGTLNFTSSDSTNLIEVEDVIIFAKNIDYNELIYYTIPLKNGQFKINHLPYGRYVLIAQSIGFEDAISDNVFDINTAQPVYGNAKLTFTVTTVGKKNMNIPAGFRLYQNYPNPFNPGTVINYSIPGGSYPFTSKVGGAKYHVTLKVYDVLGREVATLVNEIQVAGKYKVAFHSNELSSGIYFYKLTAGSFSAVKKMILIK